MFYHHERNADGTVLEKANLGWVRQPVIWENGFIGKHVGAARAKLLAAADGVPWACNLIGERWKDAHQVLDFYHASEPAIWQWLKEISGLRKFSTNPTSAINFLIGWRLNHQRHYFMPQASSQKILKVFSNG